MIVDRIRGLARVPGSRLRAADENFRVHDARQRKVLKGLLAEVGIIGAVLAWVPDDMARAALRSSQDFAAWLAGYDGPLQLVDGHMRAEELRGQAIPVLVTDLSRAEAAKALATFDAVGDLAGRDAAKLAALLEDVGRGAEEGTEELLAALRGEKKPTEEESAAADDIPEHVEPRTKPGDLWLLGAHRLLCGDSTKAEDVALVMGGGRARVMNTDPPYGVSYANAERPNPGVAKPRVAKPRVANDELTDEKLQAFLEASFKAAADAALTPDAAWYLWHAHLTQGYFAAAAAAACVVLHRQIIWVKPVLLLGRGQYHWKHEPAFMGWVKGNQPPDYGEGAGERTQTTVWEVGSVSQAERKELNHATPKPVGLFTIPIVKHTKPGEIVYEPFAGSGPQFIAAEMHGRRCFGLELDPANCDTIVARWEKFTGKAAALS